MAEIINLTDHIVRVSVGANEYEFRPAGEVARILDSRIELDPIDYDGTPIPAYGSKMVGIAGVPRRRVNTLYIVSSMVRKYLERDDLI